MTEEKDTTKAGAVIEDSAEEVWRKWQVRRMELAIALADLIAEPEGSTLGSAALAARVAYQSHLLSEPWKSESSQ